jgi:hypothetical protein
MDRQPAELPRDDIGGKRALQQAAIGEEVGAVLRLQVIESCPCDPAFDSRGTTKTSKARVYVSDPDFKSANFRSFEIFFIVDP